MFVTVAAVGLVIAAVAVTFNVSTPAPPSSASPTDHPAATSELNVSLPEPPVNAAPVSPPIVSVIARSLHILLRIKDLRQF